MGIPTISSSIRESPVESIAIIIKGKLCPCFLPFIPWLVRLRSIPSFVPHALFSFQKTSSLSLLSSFPFLFFSLFAFEASGSLIIFSSSSSLSLSLPHSTTSFYLHLSHTSSPKKAPYINFCARFLIGIYTYTLFICTHIECHLGERIWKEPALWPAEPSAKDCKEWGTWAGTPSLSFFLSSHSLTEGKRREKRTTYSKLDASLLSFVILNSLPLLPLLFQFLERANQFSLAKHLYYSNNAKLSFFLSFSLSLFLYHFFSCGKKVITSWDSRRRCSFSSKLKSQSSPPSKWVRVRDPNLDTWYAWIENGAE